MLRKILKIVGWILLALLVLLVVQIALNWDTIQRHFLGGVKVYETTAPTLPADLKRPAVLVYSKTNGHRHVESIEAANALFSGYAAEKGWSHFHTESGAAFSPEILARFDAVVFNNVSGDVFTPDQRAAFKAWIEGGGRYVGIHGSGGDFSYAWAWYVNDLIGTQFIGHPIDPQFQQATVRIEDKAHPATAGLPASWQRTDEWYSFAKSPRGPGVHVLATIDESSYSPKGMFGQDLKMGKDHPVAWWHCVGNGKVLYSAMGHLPGSYAEPEYRKFLQGAVDWAVMGKDCAAPAN